MNEFHSLQASKLYITPGTKVKGIRTPNKQNNNNVLKEIKEVLASKGEFIYSKCLISVNLFHCLLFLLKRMSFKEFLNKFNKTLSQE